MLKSAFSRLPKRYSSARAVDLSDWRSLISVRGKDAKALLQGVITNDISNLQHAGSMYSMFLNAKGRVYFDAILYHLNDDEILIDGDKTLSTKLKKHLSMYKIRRKVKIDFVENESVWHVVPGNEDLDVGFVDPRLEKMGARVLSNPNLPTISLEEYHSHRYRLGIPEGGEEIPFNKGFPLECNCDLMSGVSFHKGCYLGQELTARTFHTGVTRKRIVPVKLSPGNEAKDIKAKRSAGKILTVDSDGNGLAMFRTDNFEKPLKVGDEEIVVSKPSWWDREGDSLEFGISNHLKHLDYYSFAENF